MYVPNLIISVTRSVRTSSTMSRIQQPVVLVEGAQCAQNLFRTLSGKIARHSLPMLSHQCRRLKSLKSSKRLQQQVGIINFKKLETHSKGLLGRLHCQRVERFAEVCVKKDNSMYINNVRMLFICITHVSVQSWLNFL